MTIPPPPGAVAVEFIKVKVVPAATLLGAAALHVDPTAEATEQRMMVEPVVQVAPETLVVTKLRVRALPL